MNRGLTHAVVACLLVVCFAPVVEVTSAEIEADRQHVGRGSVAAGGQHSVLAIPDGRVSAWGRGSRGQIGDGTLTDRLSPTTVPSLAGIVGVAAGAAHTIALTREGDVYAWGANSFGRLGDGTRTRRARPVRVRGLTNMTMVAAGRAHSLALSADGSVFAWGRNTDGQLGSGNKVTSVIPLRINDLTDVVAIAAGDAHSLAVTRNGRLFAWGSNQWSTLGDGTAKDRSRPVPVALSDVVAVAGGAAHSLALLRNGAVYSWGRGANGELGTGSTRVASRPALIPGVTATAIAAGRRFSAAVREDGRVLTWGANESGQLGDRTTRRRLRPVVVESVAEVAAVALGDAHAVAVTATGDVRTWGAGEFGQLGTGSTVDRSIAAEIISDIPDWGLDPYDTEQPPDTVPPSITASTSPALQAGWMTTPITVSFQCSDNVAVASCSSPITVANDGYAQQIVGTAVDLAGNLAMVSVSVSLDLSPPALTITAPADRSAIDADVVEVSGRAIDLGSGLADGRCNGDPAVIIDGILRCTVRLHPGRNDIIFHATDVVGHNSSTAISVTRVGAGTAFTLAPATRAMLVAELATLSLRDESGMPVEQAVWSSSDDEVVTLSATDPPVLTAVAVGSATITVEKNGVIVTASIEVSPALAAGATRWTLPPLPGMRSEPPLFAHRVNASVPHMFTVEMEQWDSTLRAVTSEGEVLWQMRAPGVPVMGDSFGGVLSVVYDENDNPRAYARVGGGSINSWRYQSAGELGRPAQAPDGTIYAIERLPGGVTSAGQRIMDKYGIVLDGATGGLISRTLFRREVAVFTATWDGLVTDSIPPITCRSVYDDWAPEALDPVVGSDGRGYFVVRRHQIHQRADCMLPFQRRPDRTIEMGIDLVVLSPDAAPHTINLYSTTCVGEPGTTLPCDLPVHAVQMMPDGIGGTLVSWERATHLVGASVFVQRSLTRVNADGELAERQVPRQFWMEMMGQAGTVFSYDDGWRAMDVTTGDVKWANPLPGLALLAARPDGGLATLDVTSGDLKITDAAGAVEITQPLGLDWRAVQMSGDWIGLRGNQLTAVVGDFADATRFKAMRGNAQSQLSPSRPGVGIFGKTHLAFPTPGDLVRYRHVSIRIAPTNWEKWLETGIELRGTDDFGNGYFTLGAGSDTVDTNLRCAGTLVGDLNRHADYLTPPWDALEKLAYPLSVENSLIEALVSKAAAYPDDLPYACRPEQNPGYYNSNSLAHGLLNAVGLPKPRLPERLPTLFPGWLTPVPRSKFQ